MSGWRGHNKETCRLMRQAKMRNEERLRTLVDPSRRLTEPRFRQLIEEAVKAGKVNVVPLGASGLPTIEDEKPYKVD